MWYKLKGVSSRSNVPVVVELFALAPATHPPQLGYFEKLWLRFSGGV